MRGVQTFDIIVRRTVGDSFELRQRLQRGEFTIDGGPYDRRAAERRARQLAAEHRSLPWVEEDDGLVRQLEDPERPA
jgi:hypothetical protein